MKTDSNSKYMYIPVGLCQYSLEKKLTSTLKLFVFLKLNYDGVVKKDRIDFVIVGKSIKMKSRKTVVKHFERLIQLNWIGYNKKTNYVFIRGFEAIRSQYEFTYRSGIEIKLSEINDIKEICFTGVVLSLIAAQKRKIWSFKKSKGALKGGSALQLLPFYPIAIRAFAKILKLNVSTIYALKESCISKGYLHAERNIERTNIPNSLINQWRKNREADAIYLRKGYKQIYKEYAGKYYSKRKLFKRKKIK